MAQLSRKGDTNEVGGQILRGASSVFCNGIQVGLHVSVMTSHAPFGPPHPPHEAPTTTAGSPSVFCEGAPVLRVGSGNTCGHSIVQGSADTYVP